MAGTIREYSNPVNGLRPSSVPAEAAAQVAAGARNAQEEIGQSVGGAIAAAGKPVQSAYDTYVVQREVSQGGAVGSALVNSLSLDWNNLAKTANPNDTSIAGTFTEKTMEPALDKFIDSFKTPEGKKWATEQAQRYRDHFTATINADLASRGATAAVMNMNTVTSNLTNAAATDPSSIDFNLENARQYWTATKTNLRLNADDAAKLDAGQRANEQAIVAAGLKAAADANPTQFLKDMAAGKFSKYDALIDAEHKDALSKYANTVQSAKDVDARAADAERRRLEAEAVEGAVNKVYQDYFEVTPQGAIHVKPGATEAALKVGAMPGANSTLVPSIIGAIKTQINEETKTTKTVSDPNVYADFAARAFLPAGDPNRLTDEQIYKARVTNGDGSVDLSAADMAFFKSAIAATPEAKADAAAFNQWYSGVKGYIDKSSLFSSDTPEAKQRAADFYRDKFAEYGIERRKGRTPADIFSDPKFVANISAYQMTAQQGVDALINRASGTPAGPLAPVVSPTAVPRNAGESAADYLKRTSGAVAPAVVPLAKGDKIATDPALARPPSKVGDTIPAPNYGDDPPAVSAEVRAIEDQLYASLINKKTGITDADKNNLIENFQRAAAADRKTLLGLQENPR